MSIPHWISTYSAGGQPHVRYEFELWFPLVQTEGVLKTLEAFSSACIKNEKQMIILIILYTVTAHPQCSYPLTWLPKALSDVHHPLHQDLSTPSSSSPVTSCFSLWFILCDSLFKWHLPQQQTTVQLFRASALWVFFFFKTKMIW